MQRLVVPLQFVSRGAARYVIGVQCENVFIANATPTERLYV